MKQNGGCAEVIQERQCQVDGSRMYKFHKKMWQYRKQLVDWRKKENTNSKDQIENTTKLTKMQEEGGDRDWTTWYILIN